MYSGKLIRRNAMQYSRWILLFIILVLIVACWFLWSRPKPPVPTNTPTLKPTATTTFTPTSPPVTTPTDEPTPTPISTEFHTVTPKPTNTPTSIPTIMPTATKRVVYDGPIIYVYSKHYDRYR